MAALSFATELAMGQSEEFAMRSCFLAMALGKLVKADAETLSDIYYQAHLRYLGCNVDSQAMMALLGDEIAFRRDFAKIDMGSASEMTALVFRHIKNANSSQGLHGLVINLLKGMATAQAKSQAILSGHCEVAQRLAERLGLSQRVRDNLGQLYERWDGKGIPNGLKGEAISLAVRIVSLAQDAVTLVEAFGPDIALQRLRQRAGSAYDPHLTDMLEAQAGDLFKSFAQVKWQDVLALEPASGSSLGDVELKESCLVLADFADLKSPYSLGHSRAVATLAAEAARRLGLPKGDMIALERAGLLHDIGMVAIPARILLKPGAFSDSEWETVRLHAYHGERVLARLPGLSAYAAMAGQHHEHCNGSGYHRGCASRSFQCRP